MIPFFAQKGSNPLQTRKELWAEAKKHKYNCHVRQQIMMKLQVRIFHVDNCGGYIP